MKPIKYINYWLEALYFAFLYAVFLAALGLASVSKAFYILPCAAVLWKLFSYHIVLPGFVRGRRLRAAKKYEESLACYRETAELLQRKPWLDRYKYLLMASSLRISLLSICYSNIADLLQLCERPGEARKAARELCALEPLGVVSEFMREKYSLPAPRLYANSFADLKELVSATVPWIESVHILVCLALLLFSLVSMPTPWLVSLSAALIVGVYFFWRFGLPKLCFRGIDSPDDGVRLAGCLRALETLERCPFLERFRRIIFLSAGRMSYRDCFHASCFMLTLLKEDRAAAEEHARLITDPPVRDECLALLAGDKPAA